MRKKVVCFLLLVFVQLLPALGQKPYSKKMTDRSTKFEWVKFSNGRKVGAKSTAGKILVPCWYDEVNYENHYFSATTSKPASGVLYDEKGKQVIPKTRGYTSFWIYNADQGYVAGYKDGKAELLDSTFRVVVPASQGYTGFYMYSFKRTGYFEGKRDSLSVLLDAQFRQVIPASSGYTSFQSYDLKGDGYVSAKKGKAAVLLDAQFREVIPAWRGYTDFYLYNMKEYGYFEASRGGERALLNLQFREVIPASRGYTGYDLYGLKNYGYLKAKKGEAVALLDAQFRELVSASRGYTDYDLYDLKKYGYITAKKGKAAALLDGQGRELISESRGYTDFNVEDLKKKGYCMAKRDTLAAMLDAQFREVIPTSRGYTFFSVWSIEYGMVRMSKGKLWGVCDLKGNELVPAEYKSIYLTSEYIEYEKPDGTKGEFPYSRYGNTVSLSGSSPSSSLASSASSSSYSDDLLYKGVYTATGWSYSYSTGQYSNTGIADLKQVEIYRSRIVVGGKSIDYWKSNGQWLWYGQSNNHPWYMYNPTTGELRFRFVFNFYGQQVSDNIWVRGDQVAAYTGNATSNPAYSTQSGSYNSSSSSSPTLVTKTCGYCNGRGWVPTDEGVPTFGSSTKKWCQECRKDVYMNHWHKTCPSCNGKGTYQSSR